MDECEDRSVMKMPSIKVTVYCGEDGKVQLICCPRQKKVCIGDAITWELDADLLPPKGKLLHKMGCLEFAFPDFNFLQLSTLTLMRDGSFGLAMSKHHIKNHDYYYTIKAYTKYGILITAEDPSIIVEPPPGYHNI